MTYPNTQLFIAGQWQDAAEGIELPARRARCGAGSRGSGRSRRLDGRCRLGRGRGGPGEDQVDVAGVQARNLRRDAKGVWNIADLLERKTHPSLAIKLDWLKLAALNVTVDDQALKRSPDILVTHYGNKWPQPGTACE